MTTYFSYTQIHLNKKQKTKTKPKILIIQQMDKQHYQ